MKVGASQIAAAEVHNNGGSKLVKLAREPLEAGIVVGGEVRDIPALSRALDDFFKKHDLPRKGIRLGIGTNRVGVRVLDVDGIDDEKQLANAVTFRAHEALSIPMDQAVMDYHVVGTTPVEGGGVTHRVILAAAYREPIDQFAAAFDAADIQLDAIDVEAFALLRAVAPTAPSSDDDRTAVVALALGHDRTTLAISDGQVCDFTRVLEWGGGRLDAAIARELGVTTDEASEVKLGLSLSDDDPANARARNAVKHELTTLARSSPRFSSTRRSPIRSRSRRSWSPAAQRGCPGSSRNSSGSCVHVSGRPIPSVQFRPTPTSLHGTISLHWRSRSDWGWIGNGRRQSSSCRLPRAQAQAVDAGEQSRRPADAPRGRRSRRALRRAPRRSLLLRAHAGCATSRRSLLTARRRSPRCSRRSMRSRPRRRRSRAGFPSRGRSPVRA